MEQYTVQIPSHIEGVTPLPFGGKNSAGLELAVNSRYFLKNGKPWYPVMGEFHYSRYPQQEWEENLRKMKAGGIQIVATYVFWIHHEEEKGVWDFSGQRDLHRFLELCHKIGLFVWLRIGPWAHGEARNGGFPDWLQHDSSLKLRTDDPGYLHYVRLFYGKIMEQVKGLQFYDNGPIIGIQLENEYGHCGGESGGAGLIHMSTLKRIAKEVGFDVPFYSATGWGGGNVVDGEMLPVQGGYADAPWEQHTKELPACQNFLLGPFRNDPLIGSDYGHQGEHFTFRVEDYPFLTAELGGGIQVTIHRRPFVSGDDTGAMALCKLASGANLLGYYMYHGGTNPEGKLSTLQESTATGSYTDVPVLSYDFQGVIGEYGELHDSYRKLKNLHLFLKEFGEWIAPSVCIFPEKRITDAENTQDLRYCFRYNEQLGGGFLFVNNHQRRRQMKEHDQVVFYVRQDGKTVSFPEITIPNHFYGILPYHLPLTPESTLIASNAQLLCRLGEQFVFICDEKPRFQFDGKEVPMLVLTSKEAENAWKFDNMLYLTEAELLQEEDGIRLITNRTEEQVCCYPSGEQKKFNFKPVSGECRFHQTADNGLYKEYELDLSTRPEDGVYDMLLQISYEGDRAELYSEGKMVADWFTIGTPWRIGLSRLGYPDKLTVKIYSADRPVYYECEMSGNLQLNNCLVETKYTVKF